MTLTKADLINQTDSNEVQSPRVVETLLEVIKSKLESGEDVPLIGFDKFMVQKRTAGRGETLRPVRT
jgi:nucleoid DNA-binding protein